MRLPPQVSGVLRGGIGRPIRYNSSRGAWPFGKTSESITCQSNEVICDCSNSGTHACCMSGQSCTNDSNTGLCVCQSHSPGPTA